jgi:GNAT superfamily N-acetyltransferase
MAGRATANRRDARQTISSTSANIGGMTIEVRPPRPDEADELARINVSAWQDAYVGIVPEAALDDMRLDEFRLRWQRNLAGDHPRGASFLVGLLGEVLTSYVIFGDYRVQQDADPEEDTTGWGEIFAIYTDPAHQGSGVGLALHDAALAALAGRGIEEAALWVLRDNDRARRWYGRRGWRADGAVSMWEHKGATLPEIRLRRPLPGE